MRHNLKDSSAWNYLLYTTQKMTLVDHISKHNFVKKILMIRYYYIFGQPNTWLTDILTRP